MSIFKKTQFQISVTFIALTFHTGHCLAMQNPSNNSEYEKAAGYLNVLCGDHKPKGNDPTVIENTKYANSIFLGEDAAISNKISSMIPALIPAQSRGFR